MMNEYVNERSVVFYLVSHWLVDLVVTDINLRGTKPDRTKLKNHRSYSVIESSKKVVKSD